MRRGTHIMIYGSVCSGIEAATVAWHPLGWRAAFFSEIEKFPRAVLAERWPDVPIHGDFTTIDEGDYEQIDLLVGGTPCQDFSVAGLRAGLAGDRGNLTLEFANLSQRLRPRWLVWENVPGILSIDGGAALRLFLDMLEDLGYILDIDILDAQFFGVPQRRRRLFVCGQRSDDLIRQRTDSSALTIAQCWLEILHGILLALLPEYASGPEFSASPSRSRDGIARRMKLFDFPGETENSAPLRENLIDALARYLTERSISVAPRGVGGRVPIREDRSTASETDRPSSHIVESLRMSLVESCEVMRSFTTSTETSGTTLQQIYTCSQAALHIARLIARLNPSSPCFWNAASSALTTLEAFTNYARWTGRSLFGDVERRSSWRHFIRQAERSSNALRRIGVRDFGKVLPLSESLRGDPPPRREAGQDVARPIAGCAEGGSGWCGDADTADNLISFHGSQDPDISDDVTHPIGSQSNGFGQYIAFGIDSDCIDRSGEGADKTPGKRSGLGIERELAQAIRAKRPGAVAFAVQEIRRSAAHQNQSASGGFQVRRLTVEECERLQGFPDGYTLLPGHSSDGPRYRALGNSMCVNVMSWIGCRIELVQALLKEDCRAT